MASVFDGVRVVDLSTDVAGAMTAMLLVDNGAEVTRIEAPAHPSTLGTGGRVWTRGCRAAVLDLDDEHDLDVVCRLATTADVLVQSFAPGVASRYGLDHDALAARNPRLITCAITAYGRLARLADRPHDDALVAARTGLLFDLKGRAGTVMEHINGRPGPHPEFAKPDGLVRGADRDGPAFPRTPWPSVGAMYHAVLGITAALRAREITGAGQLVQTSLLQGALATVALNWQRVEDPDAPLYWMWPVDGRAIEGLYECADGRWVHHWTVRPRWVLSSAERDELGAVALDAAYRDDHDRLGMEPEDLLTGLFLHPMLAEAFRKFPAAEWVAAGEKAGVGVALVRSPAEALGDESFLADGCVVEVDDPEVGRIRHIGPVLELSGTPGAVRGPAPRPGEHTDAVRAEAAAVAARAPHRAPTSTRPPVPLAHPLAGIRVLDLGLGVAGPFTGRVLADLGADVVKVMAMHDTFWAGTHMGLGTNRGKRSIALDLKDPRGRDALDRLVARADVVTTNWRPGAAARLGLDFDTLHARFPRLVVCNTRGYEKGPRSDLPGTDQTAAALTGVEWEDGAHDAGNPPLWPRCSLGDTGNALLAAIAIVAALYHRDRTGEGQFVSTSIVNAHLLATSYAWIHADGTPADWGHVDAGQYGLAPHHRMYRAADDRFVFVAATSHAHRAAFAAAVGPVDDLAAAFLTRGADEWFAVLDGAGVPVEIVDEHFCRDLFDDPEARAAGLVVETQAGNVGRFEDAGLLVDLSATPGTVQRGPCLCGEHSRALLREHGYSDAGIDALVADNIVRDEPVAH